MTQLTLFSDACWPAPKRECGQAAPVKGQDRGQLLKLRGMKRASDHANQVNPILGVGHVHRSPPWMDKTGWYHTSEERKSAPGERGGVGELDINDTPKRTKDLGI